MEERRVGQRLLGAGTLVVLGGLLAACVGEPPTPAPVIMKGESDTVEVAAPPMAPNRGPPSRGYRGEGRHIVVRPGQSIGGLAEEYHVSKRAIIAANHLAPPYKIETGQRLTIPGAGERAAETIALAEPPRPSREERETEVIPLDGPPPPKAVPHAAAVPPVPSPPTSSATPAATAEARPEPDQHAVLPHGGQMSWPVRGHVLAGYGVGAGGRHNDGINIAAPQGAPVKAVEGGVVAYAGNELRGYGNLVLVKHPDGFISAYAHCEELLVKRGDKVTRGEVIAKVGATGGVSEPQLHFELRRGEHAVDPREFLSPAPSASAGGVVQRG